jgi:BNR/Asp-box repeat
MSYNWSIAPLNVGAGGWLTGGEVAPDNTMLCRTDTYGLYWHNGTRWIQLINSWNFAPNTVGMNGNTGGPFDWTGIYNSGYGGGVYECALAWSNTNRAYMLWAGSVWRTDNLKSAPNHMWVKCAGWATVGGTNSGDVSGNAQGNPGRGSWQKLAVDPNNADIVIATITGSGGGIWISRDAGLTFIKDGTVPATTGDTGCLIAFDRLGGTSGGATQRILVHCWGHGLYESTNGGTSFVSVSGGTTTAYSLTIDGTGRGWMVDGAQNSYLWKYPRGGPASSINLSSHTDWRWMLHVRENPVTHAIFVSNIGGQFCYSSDGVSFNNCSDGLTTTRSANDIPWLAATNETYMSASVFGFTSTGRLIFFEGIGVWYTDNPTKASGIDWTSISLGIEQLCSCGQVWPPDGNPILTCWDRQVFRALLDPNDFPSGHGLDYSRPIAHCTNCDFASSDPSTVVTAGTAGYSNDGGRTWRHFGSIDFQLGIGREAVAAASTTNWVYVSLDPYYTTDGGVTWHLIVLPNVPHGARVLGAVNNGSGRVRLQVDSTSGWVTNSTQVTTYGCSSIGLADGAAFAITVIDGTHIDLNGSTFSGTWSGKGYAQISAGWTGAYWTPSRVVCADRANIGTFYLYHGGQGIFRSIDGGASWNLMPSTNTQWGQGSGLKAVEGHAGHVFSCGQLAYGQGFGADALCRTLNGFASGGWTFIPNCTGVGAFCLGAPDAANGATYPTLYIVGWIWIDGQWKWGVHYSTNADQALPTFTTITGYPNGNLDYIQDLSADPNFFGQLIVGFGGSGWSLATTEGGAARYALAAASGSLGLSGAVSAMSRTSAWSVRLRYKKR